MFGNKFGGRFSEILESFSGCLMDSLITLGLGENKISGQLTDQIGKLKNLQFLYLTNNLISGPIPNSIGSLSSLRELYLHHNKLNGTLPRSIGSLSSLETLFVSNNRLEGIVSEDHFANLTYLTILSMSKNNLTLRFSTKWVPPFQLVQIFMRSCTLGPHFPKWLKSQTNIRRLDLPNTGISNIAPDWFWNFSSDYLNLNHNQISGRIPDLLHTSLAGSILLSSNRFHGPLPRISSDVVELDISNNFISGNISHFLCSHTGSQENKLSHLRLGGNLLTGNIPNCWTNWMKLRVVDLSYNNFSGKLPISMGSLSNLQSLHLRNNSLSGEIPHLLQNYGSYLKVLDLSRNAFNGIIPTWMGTSLSELLVLNLRSNQLSGTLPNELCQISSYLQIMDIGDNNLTGPIPHCFSNFTAMNDNRNSFVNTLASIYNDDAYEIAYVMTKGKELEYDKILGLMKSIDLSDNNLSGKIPREIITNLLGLRSLNLSGNHLNGTISEDIGSMTYLESLDFSRNQLSGHIPQSMSKLTFLSHLNLSYNNLTGAIPTSTQLQGLDPSSFVGNELCGPPLSKSCKIPETGRTNGEDAKQEEEEDGNHVIDEWFYFSVGIGFLVGFSCIWIPLFASTTWRLAYSRHLDSIWNKLVSCVCC